MSETNDLTRKFYGKVILIGDSGVGKTSILLRHNGQGFTTHIGTTYNASFLNSRFQTSRGCVELNVWDTAGQERFRSMLPMYARNADAAILIFDITRPGSFHSLDYWLNELTRHIPNKLFKFVLGNKSDLQESRVVSESEARAWARMHDATYFEISALSGNGIEQALSTLAENLVEYHVESADCARRILYHSICDSNTDKNVKGKNSKRPRCTIS